MNERVIAGFIIGAATGAVATYLFMKRKGEIEYNRRLTEDLLHYREEVKSDLTKTQNEADETTEEPEEPEEDTTENNTNEDEIPAEEESILTNYKNISSRYKSEEERIKTVVVDEDGCYPYPIEESSHYNTTGCYDSEDIIYNTLTKELFYDISGEKIEEADVETLFGMKNLRYFLNRPDDEIWIRNEYWATDYHIIKETGK